MAADHHQPPPAPRESPQPRSLQWRPWLDMQKVSAIRNSREHEAIQDGLSWEIMMASKSIMRQPLMIVSSFIILLLLHVLEVTESLEHFIVESLPGLPEKLPFTLETGYVGIGESEEVQLFYYFVESERNPKQDPLMLWLTGGPGCSSLSAIVHQKIGPFIFNYEASSAEEPVLELNPFSWTKVASIIFLDQPVGTGFSYATTSEAYTMTDTLSAQHTYDFLRKWLIDHPKFLDNPFYVGGDSYDGKLLPIIIQEIYNGNEVGKEPLMNIKGYMLGNPLTDTNNDFNSKIAFAHRLALISDALYESLKRNCHQEYLDVDPNKNLCVNDLREANKCLEKIWETHVLEPRCSTWKSMSNFFGIDLKANSLDILGSLPLLRLKPWCRDDNYEYSFYWANNIKVQEALNIRKETNSNKEWVRCNQSMTYVYGYKKKMSYTYNIQSSMDYHRNLTNFQCKALIYSGDHDMLVPYVGTIKWIKSLGLPLETEWKPWFVAGQIAGYTMKYWKNDYKLTFATVKGAGHTASEYKTEECFAMVDRWFNDYPL